MVWMRDVSMRAGEREKGERAIGQAGSRARMQGEQAAGGRVGSRESGRDRPDQWVGSNGEWVVWKWQREWEGQAQQVSGPVTGKAGGRAREQC